MTTNSNFNFTNKTIVTLELPEHIEELRQRIFLVFGIILLLTCVAFIDIKDLVKILELPVSM
jgi:Sec-independent protein secretion pathway component TatC